MVSKTGFFALFTYRHPALIYHVLHVVLARSDKKMVRIYTLSIVTFMAHIMLWRYFYAAQQKRGSVCVYAFSIQLHPSVSVRVERALPFKTSILGFNCSVQKLIQCFYGHFKILVAGLGDAPN